MKKILLQTMPHTGTHMMHYLFSVLGGIEVVWHHWEPNAADDIEIAKNMDWKDFVFVRTHREAMETLESYELRDLKNGTQYYADCCEVFGRERRNFPRPIVLELGDKARMTRAANEIFFRCGRVTPRAAISYMKTWKKIASVHDSEAPNEAIKQSIHKGRVETWHTNLISAQGKLQLPTQEKSLGMDSGKK